MYINIYEQFYNAHNQNENTLVCEGQDLNFTGNQKNFMETCKEDIEFPSLYGSTDGCYKNGSFYSKTK